MPVMRMACEWVVGVGWSLWVGLALLGGSAAAAVLLSGSRTIMFTFADYVITAMRQRML